MAGYSSIRTAPLRLEELEDQRTRLWMLEEFEAEQKTGAYLSHRLSADGAVVFPFLMRDALRTGNEQTLTRALQQSRYWESEAETHRKGKVYRRPLDWRSAAISLARTEFITWYVRGIARRLLEEGEESCQVYRAAPALDPREECRGYENRIYPLSLVYAGHRARYWPEPGDPSAFSIPVGIDCHHAIRRVT